MKDCCRCNCEECKETQRESGIHRCEICGEPVADSTDRCDVCKE